MLNTGRPQLAPGFGCDQTASMKPQSSGGGCELKEFILHGDAHHLVVSIHQTTSKDTPDHFLALLPEEEGSAFIWLRVGCRQNGACAAPNPLFFPPREPGCQWGAWILVCFSFCAFHGPEPVPVLPTHGVSKSVQSWGSAGGKPTHPQIWTATTALDSCQWYRWCFHFPSLLVQDFDVFFIGAPKTPNL